MNTLKSGLVVFGLIIGTAAIAQEGGEGQSAQEKAQFRTDWMEKELSLTADQKEKVSELNLQAVQKNQAIRKDASLNDEQRKEALVENRKDQREQLKTVLTAEQLKTLKAKKAELQNEEKQGKKVRAEKKPKSPVERAQLRTDKMTKELALTAEQQVKVGEINLKAVQKNDEIRQNTSLTKEQQKEAMRKNHQAQKEEFKQVLTKEQLKNLKEYKEEQRENQPKK